jgi:hypothetical protein
MSKQESWIRRVELLVALAAALVIVLAYIISRVFPS